MSKVINCPCGEAVRGDSDEELLSAAHQHMDEAHEDMTQRPSDDDLLASAVEE
jgi:predicted small metal-binding protein